RQLSYPSGRRPRFSATRHPGPGVNFIAEFVPLSTTHRLSYLSNRTECAYPRPYTPWPISPMYFPLASNSSRFVVAFPYNGPEVAVPGWFSTTTVPFELTATLRTSPKFILGGSFSGSGTDSNWRIGAFRLSTAGRCCA